MAKQKRILTEKQKAEKTRLRQEYEWVFINGKQKRVRRPRTIDGMDVDEYIRQNADPIWLHQEGLWEYLMTEEEILDSELLWMGEWQVVDAQSAADLG